MITRTVPVIALAYGNSSGGTTWADTRVMCLKTPNVVARSRKVNDVPSKAGRTAEAGLDNLMTLLVAAFIFGGIFS